MLPLNIERRYPWFIEVDIYELEEFLDKDLTELDVERLIDPFLPQRSFVEDGNPTYLRVVFPTKSEAQVFLKNLRRWERKLKGEG